MSTQHDRFLARLEGSRPAVKAVADWFRRKGRAVEVPDILFASSPDLADLYADRYDIMVDGDKPIQVKGLQDTQFSGAHDWPHPVVFVSSKASVDRNPHIVAYVIVSVDLKTVGVILAATRDRWHVDTRRVKNTGNIESNYACALDCVIFKRIAIGEESARPIERAMLEESARPSERAMRTESAT